MIYTDDDLEQAVANGILSREQVDGFRVHIKQTQAQAQSENMPLITSFNDVFVVIACGLFFWGVYGFFDTTQFWVPSLAAVLAWGLAEYFTRHRRMALPSILLLAVFGSAVYLTAFNLAREIDEGLVVWGTQGSFWSYVLATLITMATLFAHWWRFHVPITIAALAGNIVLLIILPVFKVYDYFPMLVWFLCGLGVLVAALYYDSLDRQRLTIDADIAFWLHALAAPTLVHPVFIFFINGFSGSEMTPLLLMLGIYLLISVFSLLIDRRVLIVSSLGYATYALSELTEISDSSLTGITVAFIFLGIYMLLLSVFWQALRFHAMKLCPAQLRDWLPVVSLPPSRQ